MLSNGVGGAVTVNGIAAPMGSFVASSAEPVGGRYRMVEFKSADPLAPELNTIPLSERTWKLLNMPIPALMKAQSTKMLDLFLGDGQHKPSPKLPQQSHWSFRGNWFEPGAQHGRS